MEMSERKTAAITYFKSGRNCAQAVLLAYRDWLNLDEATALSIASGFGGGVGRTRGMCGAFSAMVMLAAHLAEAENAEGDDRPAAYAMVQRMKQEFEAVNGSVICSTLLNKPKDQPEAPIPDARDAEYYRKRPCAKIVASACDVLDRLAYEK